MDKIDGVPSYRFRCFSCGEFEETIPLASDSSARPCPVCDASARKVFVPVGLGLGGGTGMRLADLTRASASDPAVVCAPPPRRAHRPASDPRTANLPKP